VSTSAVSSPAFTHEVSFVQNPIHRPFRAQVNALVEQRRVYLRWSEITEAIGTQHLVDGLSFNLTDLPRDRRVLPDRFRA
jgi:hypothetical protein